MQEGIPRSSFPFHFHSVSGPQPYIVIAPELNACPSLQDMIHNSFPDSFRHFVWPFLGFSSFGQTTKKGEICFKVYISLETCGMCRAQIVWPEALVILLQFFIKCTYCKFGVSETSEQYQHRYVKRQIFTFINHFSVNSSLEYTVNLYSTD